MGSLMGQGTSGDNGDGNTKRSVGLAKEILIINNI